MLLRLTTENYTVMPRVEVTFAPGLNVITGETGVGKSLLLDAVGFLLGERRGGFPVRSGCSRAVIEAEFDTGQKEAIQSWLEGHDYPPDLPVILRREFYDSGRTRIFINDVPSSVSLSRELGNMLLDLHDQHEVVALFDRARQLEFLDAFARHVPLHSRYKQAFQQVEALREEQSQLQNRIRDSSEGRDALERQKKELDSLNPQPGEIETIEADLNRLENSEQIFDLCAEICDKLNEAPGSALEHLGFIREKIVELFPYDSSLQSWENELGSVHSVLMELNRTLQALSKDVRHDPERVEELRQRITSLIGFRKRWNHPDKDLCEVAEEVDRRLVEMKKLDERLDELAERIAESERELISAGKELSQSRKKAAGALQKQVLKRLTEIGMKKANFKIEFDPLQTEHPYSDGLDRIEFTLSPDGKIPHQPLRQVASGGEMSRILLALKGSLAQADRVETLIFDEVDQGISGRIARMVGLQLLELAGSHQVIVVTHLPQIASLGDAHLSVRSTGEGGAAAVQVLAEDERIQELAALLAASGISEGALLNAREMLDSARSLRNSP